MPTYEYACPTCGIVEAFQSIKEPALSVCPTCGHKGITRMVSSGAGVIFKGSGFWETDYNRSKDYATKSSAEKKDAAKPAAAPAEAAPAPKPQPATQAKPAPTTRGGDKT